MRLERSEVREEGKRLEERICEYFSVIFEVFRPLTSSTIYKDFGVLVQSIKTIIFRSNLLGNLYVF